MENISENSVLLPDVYGPEWSVRNAKSGASFPKSLPWISSRSKRGMLGMRPNQVLCHLYGTDSPLPSRLLRDLIVECKFLKSTLRSNRIGAPWHLKRAGGKGLNIDIVELFEVNQDVKSHLRLLLPECDKYELTLPEDVFDMNEPRIVLLLSNQGDEDVSVKGFNSSAWQVCAEMRGRCLAVPISNLVARKYLDDFVLKCGCSKALVFGVPNGAIDNGSVRFHVSYADGIKNMSIEYDM